jgi:hypothetical protein
VKLTAAQELPHMLSAYRQGGADSRRRILTNLMHAARRRGDADTERLCEHMLAVDELSMEWFSIIVARFVEWDADLQRGRVFAGRGKHPDAVGRWLDTALQRTPKPTTAELWAMLTKKPPRGYVVEADSYGGTLYRKNPWTQTCTRGQWRDRVRRARERLHRTA